MSNYWDFTASSTVDYSVIEYHYVEANTVTTKTMQVVAKINY